MHHPLSFPSSSSPYRRWQPDFGSPPSRHSAFGAPALLTPQSYGNTATYPEANESLPTQNPGGAFYPKPPQDAPPDFGPSPQLTENENLTTPSLKQRHTRRTCGTVGRHPGLRVSFPLSPEAAPQLDPTLPGHSRPSLQFCSGAAEPLRASNRRWSAPMEPQPPGTAV